MSKVLTFDLGTTYFKVCLFDNAARLVAVHRVAVPIERPVANRAELPVTTFRQLLTDAVHDLSRKAGGLRDVTRISFASQANTFTLLDKGSKPLIPFILWTDERASSMEATIPLAAHTDYFSVTGIPSLTYLFLPAKIHWLHTFAPEVMSRARQLCTMGDYLVWWLTGNRLTEAGLAGLSGLVDIHRLRYWTDAIQQVELPQEWLREIVRAGSEVGRLRVDAANKLGLSSDCQVVMGCLDQYAGAIGAGNTKPGGVSETTGTVLATVRCTDKCVRQMSDGVFQGPAFVDGVYYEMVFSELSASVLERYRNSLPDHPSFAELDKLAAQVPAGAEGLRLYADAVRRPGNDLFVNRRTVHNRGHEVRAILEAVAFELRHQVSRLCGENWPQSISASGGGANSKLWLQIKSELLGCAVKSIDCPEPASLSATLLALGQCKESLQNRIGT